LCRLFIQYFWRSKNIGGVQGEKSCKRNENVFASSLSHHQILLPNSFAEQKYWRGAGREVLQGLFRRALPFNPLRKLFEKSFPRPFKNFLAL